MGLQTKIYSSQPGLPAHREVLLQRSSVQLLFSCSVQNGQFSLRKIKVMMLRKASTKTPTKTFQFSENFQVGVSFIHYAATVLVRVKDLRLASGAMRPAAHCQSRRSDKLTPSLPLDGKQGRINLTWEVGCLP